MPNPIRCQACHKFGAKQVLIEAVIMGVTRIWTLRLCQWDWRALEAMVDLASDEQTALFGPGVQVQRKWLW